MPAKKLSKEVIESWPEIFETVDLNVVPIRYLCSVHVTFKDKRKWDIDIKPSARNDNWQSIERNIHEIVCNYKQHIESIDFKLDTEKIKKDISKVTNKFLKNRKLV
jgi:hypothetical protein